MIFKTELQGYCKFILLHMKVGAFCAVVLAVLLLTSNTTWEGVGKTQSTLVGAGVIFIFGFFTSLVVAIRDFADRRDPYIFQGYFPLELTDRSIAEVIQLLEKMGYQPGSSKYPGTTMQRVAWPGPEFCQNHLNFRPYVVNIQESPSGVQLRFFDENLEFEFDGKQVAYNAAQEFKRIVGV